MAQAKDSRKKSLFLDAVVVDEITQIAKDLGRSRSEIFREAWGIAGKLIKKLPPPDR
jgi:hypothetical protein